MEDAIVHPIDFQLLVGLDHLPILQFGEYLILVLGHTFRLEVGEHLIEFFLALVTSAVLTRKPLNNGFNPCCLRYLFYCVSESL